MSNGNDQTRYQFRPRAIGMNWLRCFVCGSTNGGKLDRDGLHYDACGAGQSDMASFVENHAAGLRVQALFVERGFFAYLDWRPSEPQHIQVKLGACEKHRRYLELLRDTARSLDGWIDADVVSRMRDEIRCDERE